MFYTFNQNNSGGSFDFDDRGISHYVIIEADGYAAANARAEEIGLYFNGENDCSCCGNRWYGAWWDSDGSDVPKVYGEDVSSGIIPAKDYSMKWINGPEGFIHYADGRVVAIDYAKEIN